jgi:putative ABC transport system permease protein
MLIAAMRDMQWRKRRFVIAILSTSIIFAMTLVLTGLANGFRVEAEKTVNSLGVDVFLVEAGASGPFVGATPFAPVDLPRIASVPGVVAAAPLAYAGGTATLGDATRNVDIFGAPESGPGMPAVSQGSVPSTPDEVAVSSTLGRQIGDDVEIASRRLRVTGIVQNSTALANLPNVFLTTEGAQRLVYGGGSLVSAIGIRGTLGQVPDGYRAIDRAGAIGDLLRPLKVARDSITIVAVMLWVVAALIVGSVIYLSAIERLRDFAVFKAIGVPTAPSWPGWRCRRSWSHCVPRSSVPGFPGCWDRCSRCRSSSRCRPSSRYPSSRSSSA